MHRHFNFTSFVAAVTPGIKTLKSAAYGFALSTRNDIECRHTYELARRDFRWGVTSSCLSQEQKTAEAMAAAAAA